MGGRRRERARHALGPTRSHSHKSKLASERTATSWRARSEASTLVGWLAGCWKRDLVFTYFCMLQTRARSLGIQLTSARRFVLIGAPKVAKIASKQANRQADRQTDRQAERRASEREREKTAPEQAFHQFHISAKSWPADALTAPPPPTWASASSLGELARVQLKLARQSRRSSSQWAPSEPAGVRPARSQERKRLIECHQRNINTNKL